MFKYNQQQGLPAQAGQTLIETIVAVGIMILGITAVLSLAIATLTVTDISKEKIVALNLAREGIEITRAVRDTGWLRDDLCWNSTENPFCGLAEGEWLADYNTDIFSEPNSPTYNGGGDCTNCQLKINSDGLYNLTDGSPTVYNRMVIISPGDFDKEKKIISKVWWQEHNRTHSIELETRLTNWR